ncbi:MAG: NAD(+)/NADH kinase [Mollicutes bacterium]|nr:NAD(+)/NADH kinase [Mollicutes bacterium]
MIKKIWLYPNNDDKSIEISNIIKEKLISNGYIIDKNCDLVIAIGGDGTFLRMVKKMNFNSNIYYVGINTGTLGFLQEIKVDEVDCFIKELKNGEFKIEEIGIQETEIETNNKKYNYLTLNEIVIRDKNLKATKLNIKINGDLLERFIGDGILIATSTGSTAYNLSFGGSIVYNTFNSLQITPIAPINTKVYRALRNSVIIPNHKEIIVEPEFDKKDLHISFDGNSYYFDNVKKIKTEIKDKTIKCIRLKHYNFPKKINEKLLTD